MAVVAGVGSSVLRWARERQGLSVEEVARKLKRSVGEVNAWEDGSSAPTYSQLERLAYKIYKRPLAVFFLPAPPQESKPKQEFRTLPDAELDDLTSDTRYRIRLARAFQISLRELNDDLNPAPRKIFRDIQFGLESEVRRTAARIREYLGVSMAVQTSWESEEKALHYWRNAIEAVGVFVFKHAFRQSSISGFCLADEEFPVIYLNNSTSKTRQIFSLLHELIHVILHTNSISKFDPSSIDLLPQAQKRVEQFCNELAAEVLMPSDDFAEQIRGVPDFEDARVASLARRYRVSREAILRSLLDRRLVSRAYYEKKAEEWADEWKTKRKGRKAKGDANRTTASYLGRAYLQLVFGKHYQGRLSTEQVADYLGITAKRVPAIEALLPPVAGPRRDSAIA